MKILYNFIILYYIFHIYVIKVHVMSEVYEIFILY